MVRPGVGQAAELLAVAALAVGAIAGWRKKRRARPPTIRLVRVIIHEDRKP